MQVLRPNDSLIIQAGPLFQRIRGLIFALVLFPFRRIFVESKYGWIYLWGLFLVLSLFSTIGPGGGSIEGLIYTQLPAVYHLIVLPEGILQTLLFSLLLITWERHKVRKITIPLVVIFFIMVVLSLLGLFTST